MNVLLVALMCIRMVHGQSSSTSSFSTANVTSTSAQPTPPSTTVTPTTISTTTEACPSSLCANAPTTCNYQSNEDYACLSLALCLGGFEADFTPGPCNACDGGRIRDGKGRCNLPALAKTTIGSVNTTTANVTVEVAFTELHLQADDVVVRSSAGTSSIPGRLAQVQEALEQGLESLGGGLLADDAILKTDVDLDTASVETKLDADSLSLEMAMSQLVTTLSNKVASDADIASFETAYSTRGLKSELNAANNILPTKRDLDPSVTRVAVDNLLLQVTQDRDALSTHATSNYAQTSNIEALRTAAEDTIVASRVYTRGEVDSTTATLEAVLATKADIATTATGEEVEALEIKTSPVLMAKGDAGCAVADVGTVKYNPSSRKFEVCSQGTVRQHWRPVGSTKDCVAVDKGKCTRCDGGMAVSRSAECIPAANVVHLDLNNDKVNQASHASAEPPILVNLATNAFRAGEGPGGEGHALTFSNANKDYVSVPTTQIGGQATFCAFVKFNSYTAHSPIMGLFSGTDSEVTFRNDVTSDNLVWKFERGTKNAVVRINDFWAISLNYWTHFCGTIGDNVMGVYRDGVAMDATPSTTPADLNNIDWQAMYVGASPRQADRYFDGQLANFRVYNRVLTEAQVQTDMCGSRSKLDCVGLLSHLVMDNNKVVDLSLAQWLPTMAVRSGPAYRFHLQGPPRVPGGRPSIQLDGNNYYEFPNRDMAGGFSFCMWWKRNNGANSNRAFVLSNLQSADGVELLTGSSTTINDARFRTRRGTTERQMIVGNGLVGTRDAFLHVCGTVSATDRMVLYVSGRQVGSRSAYGLQDVARSRRYLGRGAWSADTGSFVSEYDDVRFYNYPLSAAEVKTLACGDKADIDCGLWGHFTFEHDSHDVSGAGWHPKLNEAAQAESVFVDDADVPQGKYALYLDGKGTHLELPNRHFSNRVSVCFYAKWKAYGSNAAILDFGRAAASHNIRVALRGTTDDLSFVVYDNADAKKELFITDAFKNAVASFQHYCLTLNSDKIMRAYVNGVLQTKTTAGVDMTVSSTANRNNNLIGHSISTASDSHLYLDDVRIYSDRDVTTADVAAIYAKRNSA